MNIPDVTTFQLTDYRDQVDVLIAEGCKIVSFTFGNLDEESICRFKNSGTTLIGTCTSVKEAVTLQDSGIDILCVQGFEAGGHRGSFAQDNIPEIGGLALLPQVYDAVSVPLVYAGGIYNGKTLCAVKLLGAQGFQVGSMLLCTKESALLDFEKNALQKAQKDEVVLTKSFSGRYARGLKNAFITALDDSPYVLPYPYQNKLTASLRQQAKRQQHIDFVSVWTGNALPAFSDAGTTDVLLQLKEEAERMTLENLL